MMQRFCYCFIVVVLIVFVGCSTQKQISEKQKPDWITKQLSDKDYYQGVGYVQKEKKSTTHYDVAKTMALKNLAEEISVDISSSTIHISYENDLSLKDDFTSVIESRVNSSLEGYEIADTYENSKEYWVLYRLSKQKYASIQAQKRTKAIELSVSHFLEAEKYQKDSDMRNAIIFYAKSLDDLKAYFNETITAEVNNQKINLISESYNCIYRILSDIEIVAKNKSVDCKVGYKVDSEQLACEVIFQGKKIKNFPLVAFFSENAQQQKLNSDANGIVQTSLLVKSQKSVETFEFSVDKTTLLLQSATDFAIRKWLQKIPTTKTTILLKISKPSISISSVEKNIGIVQKDNVLKAKLEQLLLANGYNIVSKNADFEVSISSDTKGQTQTKGIFTTLLNAQFRIKNLRNGAIVEAQNLTTKGTQLSYKVAGEKAYEEATRQIEARLFSSFINAFLKTE
jgi:hypothetical protein